MSLMTNAERESTIDVFTRCLQLDGSMVTPAGYHLEYKVAGVYADWQRPDINKNQMFSGNCYRLVSDEPQLVPLGPEDVIDWVRHNRCKDRYRVLSVNRYGIRFGDSTLTWNELKSNGFEFSNDHGATWQPCSKLAK